MEEGLRWCCVEYMEGANKGEETPSAGRSKGNGIVEKSQARSCLAELGFVASDLSSSADRVDANCHALDEPEHGQVLGPLEADD